MSAAITIGAGQRTATELGEQAEQAVQALVHLTRPGLGALADPADAAELAAALARLTGGLPQLASQLAGWLTGEERAGRLHLDDCPPDLAATEAAITEVTAALAQAGHCAHAASQALDAAQQILARLVREPEGRA